MRITLDLGGDVQLDRQLARYLNRVVEAEPAFQAMADYVGKELLKNFISQGRYASGGWAPLSPKYAKWKAKRYPGAPILVRTGQLRRDLTRRPFGVERITDSVMEIGTDLPYAEYHQTGGRHLPRRRPFELTDTARKELVKIMQRWIARGEIV